ncbi:hypothetical protein ACFQ6B_27660 [Streptomyces wedmorensis]|uniref:Cryptochrome/photolyase family protein n=1 Tax=Streptomyces wedmorensis TaxID=43759 RepID=A0ABW6IWA4_STRWE
MTDTHWLFGDQLGPSFLAPGGGGPPRDAPVVMIESRSVFRHRRFHRAKAHLVLAAFLLHRHRERLGRNARMSRPVRGLERLRDLPALLEQEQERARGGAPP